MSVDVSIIVVTHNTCNLTLRCIEAAKLDATASEIKAEVVVVDNASTDGTVTTIRAVFDDVQVIGLDKNLGFAKANNIGVAHAKGRFCFLINSDAFIQPGALRILLDFMHTHPEAGACGPMLLNEDGSLQPSGRPLPTVWSVFVDMTKLYRLARRDVFEQRKRDYQQIARVGEISGAAILIRREVYEAVGGFDPKFFTYYEDVDLCKRIGEAGYAIYYVPHAKVIHLWHRTSQNLPEATYQAGQDSMRYYFRKHHGLVGEVFIHNMLVAKELVLLLIALLRKDRSRVRFHTHMLRRLASSSQRA